MSVVAWLSLQPTCIAKAREVDLHRCVSWPYAWGAIEGRDDRALFVFVDSAHVVAAFEQTIDRGNFTSAARIAGYPRDSATFRLRREGQLSTGAPHVVASGPNVVELWQP